MSEKLTLEIVMKYYKAKVTCYDEKILYDIHFIDLRNEKLYLRNKPFEIGSDRDDISISDCKLQLRPLSSLTDEEKSEIKKIYFISNIKSDDVGYLTFKVDGYSDEQIWYDDIKVADYLRSINIHVGDLPEGVYIYE